jgi:AbrB family looped-hinge helix DNA binding protein
MSQGHPRASLSRSYIILNPPRLSQSPFFPPASSPVALTATIPMHFILALFYIPYYNVRKRELSMAVATLTSKGQITIPSRVREALGLEKGDRVEFVEQGKGQFAIVAATRSVHELKGMFQRKRSKPVSIEEMNAAIARRACGLSR